jgi:hypothetical protein
MRVSRPGAEMTALIFSKGISSERNRRMTCAVETWSAV